MGLRALALALALASGPALADPFRIATYSPDLSRDGPGLLLRDILSGKDEQVAAAVQVIAAAEADVVLLTGFAAFCAWAAWSWPRSAS